MSRLSRFFLVAILVALIAPLAISQSKQEQIDALKQEVELLRQSLVELEKRCDPKFGDRLAKIEQRLSRLETQLKQVSQKQAAMPHPKEDKARAAFGEIRRLIATGKTVDAKAKMLEFTKEYSGTRIARQAQTIATELSVIGIDAPAEYKITKWFQGEDKVQLGSDALTVLVFWEVWCPHCKREVPKIERMWKELGPQGTQIVALTKVNRGATDEKVQDFLTQQNVTYPVAKEDGQLSRYFKVRGVPAAAVVKAGKVVWRGHPAHLSASTLASLK